MTVTPVVPVMEMALYGDYKNLVLYDAPDAYWRLNEASGLSFADSSGHGRTMSVGAATGYTRGVATQQPDLSTGLGSDGTQSALTCASFTAGTTCSFEFWIKPVASGTTYSGIVGAGGGGAGVYWTPSSRKINCFTTADHFNNTALTAGQVYHVVISIAAGNGTFYLNGVADGTFTAWPGQGISNLFVLGGGQLVCTFLSDVSVWASVALSATQALEHYLAGHFTDVSSDVLTPPSVKWSRGIEGRGPMDRVAKTGQMTFALDNSARNSAKLLGYYSPDHANCRTGFRLGVVVRFSATFGGTTYRLWRGQIEEITPMPGARRERMTSVTCVDWMNHAAEEQLATLGVLTNTNDQAIMNAIVAAMSIAPVATSFAAGEDTYAYAFDTTRTDTTPMEEFQKVAQSGLGFIFVKGDGTLVFENRASRSSTASNQATFDNTMLQLQASRQRNFIINKVQAIVHQRKVDAAATTELYAITTSFSLNAGESKTVFGPYRDPNQLAARVGGTDMVTPIVATTDYTANTAADGSGSDLTANMTVVTSATASGVSFTVTNAGATPFYVTKLRVRGRGIYDYVHVVSIAQDATSQWQFGAKAIDFDMPYQSDINVGSNAAAFLLNLFASDLSVVDSITIAAGAENSTLMTQALSREISDRIGVRESVTGVSDASGRGYFINGIEGEYVGAGRWRVKWIVAPADQLAYWLLDTVGRSELDINTRPAFL